MIGSPPSVSATTIIEWLKGYGYTVWLIDEFLTSQTCPKCKSRLLKDYSDWKRIYCSSNTCAVDVDKYYFDRNRVACQNMAFIVEHYYNNRHLPAEFPERNLETLEYKNGIPLDKKRKISCITEGQ